MHLHTARTCLSRFGCLPNYRFSFALVPLFTVLRSLRLRSRISLSLIIKFPLFKHSSFIMLTTLKQYLCTSCTKLDFLLWSTFHKDCLAEACHCEVILQSLKEVLAGLLVSNCTLFYFWTLPSFGFHFYFNYRAILRAAYLKARKSFTASNIFI